MKLPKDEARKQTNELKRRFFLGLPEDYYSEINVLSSNSILASFKNNILSLEKAVSLPFMLSKNFAHNKLFSMHLSRNAILYPELDSDAIHKNAQIDFEKSLDDQDDANSLFINLCSPLISLLEDESDPAKELINQGILQSWSAFEVFERDFIENYINSYPKIIKVISENDSLRKRNDIRKISFDFIFESDFNVSTEMGTLVVNSYDCSDLIVIKELIKCCTDDEVLLKLMNDPLLWRLFQIRHLLIHRRGIIDLTFNEKTGLDLTIGTKIIIKPSELVKYLLLLRDVVVCTIKSIRMN